MKKLIVMAAAVSLAACTQTESEPEPMEADTVAVEEPIATTAADGGPSTGMYTVTDSEGVSYTQEVRADGTYTNTMADGSTTTGLWEQQSPAIFCTDEDGDDAGMECGDETIDEAGVWTAVDRADGAVHTVERMES